MDAGAVDAYFDEHAGPVWRELRGGLWHRTGSHLFRRILECGEIQSYPDLPAGQLRWGELHTTQCRSMGGVSLFDFMDARWRCLFANGHETYWLEFLGECTGCIDPDIWLSTVWLAIDRDSLSGFVTLDAAGEDWDNDRSRKWMPWIEACQKGPIPLSACTHAVIVCAADAKVFKRMKLHPFDAVELGRLEAEWRQIFSGFYEDRTLTQAQRIARALQSFEINLRVTTTGN